MHLTSRLPDCLYSECSCRQKRGANNAAKSWSNDAPRHVIRRRRVYHMWRRTSPTQKLKWARFYKT